MRTECSVYRGKSGTRVRVFTPDGLGAGWWLQEACGAGTRPRWDGQAGCWEVARKHYTRIVVELVEHYGQCTTVEEFNTAATCTEHCQRAVATAVDECVCRCRGEQHGEHRDDGVVIGWSRYGGGDVLRFDDGWERVTRVA